jgi:CubicO group peptidase (beta-lactamase class C family)
MTYVIRKGCWEIVLPLKISLLAGIFLIFGSCHENPSSPSISSSSFVHRDAYAWPVSTPAAQGYDTTKISAALEEMRTTSFLWSFLVVHNDSLILEYYSSYQKENDFDIHSASKSFTSALVGIAIDRGIVKSVQEKILSYFPDFDTAGLDPRKRDWTLEQFLTMRSGLDWDETADHTALYTDKVNWMYTTLGLPLRYSPGEQFVYTTPNVNLLSGILTRSSGMSTYEFAEKFLFTPLRISVRSWAQDPQGVYTGGAGMTFTPRDLARLGQLYLHNGICDGVQVVSRQWVQQTLIARNQINSTWGDFKSVNYGYLWWNNYQAPDSIFMAAGFAGQFVFVVPSKNMVIVTIGNDNYSTAQASENETVIIGIARKYFF